MNTFRAVAKATAQLAVETFKRSLPEKSTVIVVAIIAGVFVVGLPSAVGIHLLCAHYPTFDKIMDVVMMVVGVGCCGFWVLGMVGFGVVHPIFKAIRNRTKQILDQDSIVE